MFEKLSKHKRDTTRHTSGWGVWKYDLALFYCLLITLLVKFLFVLLWRHFVPKQNNWKSLLKGNALKEFQIWSKILWLKNCSSFKSEPGFQTGLGLRKLQLSLNQTNPGNVTTEKMLAATSAMGCRICPLCWDQ